MRTDVTGVGITCPLINQVQDFIMGIDWDMDDENECELAQGSRITIDTLEDIRTANAELRQFGITAYEEKNELENQVSALEQRIKELQEELEEKNQEISELEDELENIEQ